MSTDLSAYDNSWYRPGPVVKRACWYVVSLLFFRSYLFPFYTVKAGLLRLFGARVGKNLVIKPGVIIKYPWFLEIGDNVWLGEKCWIDNLAKVTIGNNVCLSQGCLLLTGNHDYTNRAFSLIVNEIVLEDGVWIGARSTVIGGAICRKDAVLTLASVAAGELQPRGIYRGNPAVWIKERIFTP